MRPILLIALLAAAASTLPAGDPKPAAVKQPELRAELIERAAADQRARMSLFAASAAPAQQARVDQLTVEARRVDSENRTRLEQIVAQHGWPGRALVGDDGAHAAWLLIQHADAWPKFQRKCLDLMLKLPAGEVSPADVAYLTDRVLLAEGRKQLYGTQFKKLSGRWQPLPIEDEAHVGNRRAAVGLPPLAEYAKQLEAVYSGTSGDLAPRKSG